MTPELQASLLSNYLYDLGEFQLSERVLDRIHNSEASRPLAYFSEVQDYSDDWHEVVDSWGNWSRSWAGQELMSDIANLELSYEEIQGWVKYLKRYLGVTHEIKLKCSEESAQELVYNILDEGRLECLADLLDWRSSSEGFHFWYDIVRSGVLPDSIERGLKKIKKPQPENQEGA
jgi:hypothetical protein